PAPTLCPGGGTGRHTVLRGRRRKACEFESRPGHHVQRALHFVSSTLLDLKTRCPRVSFAAEEAQRWATTRSSRKAGRTRVKGARRPTSSTAGAPPTSPSAPTRWRRGSRPS